MKSRSEAGDAAGIRKTAIDIIEAIRTREHKIPSMHLVTFGDNGTSSVRPEDHTEVIGTTDNFAVFKKWLNDIKFSGGGDAFEQGALGESVQYAHH